jgi:glutaredoxin
VEENNMLKAIRWVLGRIILFISWITTPKSMSRSTDMQNEVNKQCKKLSLYQYHACPFCVKTRRTIKRLNLPIELRDALNDSTRRQQLENEGGKVQVPCLRIEKADGSIEWMYESNEINAYLNSQFS